MLCERRKNFTLLLGPPLIVWEGSDEQRDTERKKNDQSAPQRVG
jgi:hypothetical protein